MIAQAIFDSSWRFFRFVLRLIFNTNFQKGLWFRTYGKCNSLFYRFIRRRHRAPLGVLRPHVESPVKIKRGTKSRIPSFVPTIQRSVRSKRFYTTCDWDFVWHLTSESSNAGLTLTNGARKSWKRHRGIRLKHYEQSRQWLQKWNSFLQTFRQCKEKY